MTQVENVFDEAGPHFDIEKDVSHWSEYYNIRGLVSGSMLLNDERLKELALESCSIAKFQSNHQERVIQKEKCKRQNKKKNKKKKEKDKKNKSLESLQQVETHVPIKVVTQRDLIREFLLREMIKEHFKKKGDEVQIVRINFI